MKHVFLFCPENDIALAQGNAFFTPPRQAALLAHYGAPLMWWMGEEDDFVLVPPAASQADSASFARWHEGVRHSFGAGPRVIGSVPRDVAEISLSPWGWSAYTVVKLHAMGATAEHTAAVERNLQNIRRLSHRRSATYINGRLAEMVDWDRFRHPVPVAATEVFSQDEAESILASRSGGCYVKSPWSSSGRGVFRSDAVARVKLLEMCAGTIASQGSVLMEQAFDKVADFAMLFRADAAGTVRFGGYSLFFNSRATAYSGNLIATDDTIIERVSAYVEPELLDSVRAALETILTELLDGHYSGWLGVDMMVARTTGARDFILIPCVEMNLRMTMGVVAHRLANHALLRGRKMVVLPGRAPMPTGGVETIDLVPENPFFRIIAVGQHS